MKLLNYTTSYFAAVLLLLISVWAILFYFEMMDEINDSLDDGLENQKMLVIQRAKQNPTILQKSTFEDGYYTIQPINFSQAEHFKDSYRDTLMYMENEEDYEPVRLLETAFGQDGSYYKMKVITSKVEEDDLKEDLLYSLLFLYLGLIVSILVLNNLLLKKVWHPFYKLLHQLKNFSIEKDEKIDFERTNIEEFSLLNRNIEKLLQKAKSSYKSQKQFIENASHELQTPIAIAMNQLELLIENNALEEKQIEMIAAVLNNLERLNRFNQSLLLLSKIENKQYVEVEPININTLIKQLKNDFDDFITHQKMRVKITENDRLQLRMNPSLAQILFTNLLKNAILHSEENSEIEIRIDKDGLTISNHGEKALEKGKLFERFYKKGKMKNSTGLGLSIAKSIAEKYNLTISYTFQNAHIFRVQRK